MQVKGLPAGRLSMHPASSIFLSLSNLQRHLLLVVSKTRRGVKAVAVDALQGPPKYLQHLFATLERLAVDTDLKRMDQMKMRLCCRAVQLYNRSTSVLTNALCTTVLYPHKVTDPLPTTKPVLPWTMAAQIALAAQTARTLNRAFSS